MVKGGGGLLPASACGGRHASLDLGTLAYCNRVLVNSPMCRAGKSSTGGMITSSLLMAVEEAHLTRGFKIRNSLKMRWKTWPISAPLSLAGSDPLPLDRAWLRSRKSFPSIVSEPKSEKLCVVLLLCFPESPQEVDGLLRQ